MHTRIATFLVPPRAALAVCGAAAGALLAPAAAQAQACERDLTADVVALDQQVFYNRLGAFDPGGMMYALRRDVVAADPSQPLGPGNARLRAGKRPRPMALRMNEGDCLTINFTNLLATTPVDHEQPATRSASIWAPTTTRVRATGPRSSAAASSTRCWRASSSRPASRKTATASRPSPNATSTRPWTRRCR